MSAVYEEPPEERLFQAALAFPPGEREAFIREAAGDEVELVEAVLLLLQGYEEAGGDDASATVGSARQRWVADEEAGTMIDHFRLLRILGRGGMGTVWEAQQTEPVERRVALKVIKPGMDTEEVVRRFERERQTLALMQHPNIAQVLEAGVTLRGRPYFVMELVPGEPITAFCESAGRSVAERLALFLEVCAAIEHAHQRGIIHRDLKPSNLLVHEGVVKVIDFGVAKATRETSAGQTLLTKREVVLGTPAYMSPEQARSEGGGIDTRSDVYSLGVLLYELLTGKLPFDPERLAETGVAELQRILGEELPLKPSSHLSSLERDLDWIVMKALRKEPERRYASVAALREDLERFLAGEPVKAAPPTFGYQLGKFVHRHRWGVVAGSAIALAVTASAVVSVGWAMRARAAAAKEAEARRDTVVTLERTYGQLATDHGKAGRPAQAALWSAKAAGLDTGELEGKKAARLRVALWTREAIVPVRAFASSMREIRELVFHPRELHLLAEDREGTRELWDIERERLIEPGGNRSMTAATWSRDGEWFVLAAPDRNELLLFRHGHWEVPASGVSLPDKSEGPVAELSFNVEDNLFAVARGSLLSIYQFDHEGGEAVHAMDVPVDDLLQSVQFSPTDPNLLAFTSARPEGSRRVDPRANVVLLNPEAGTFEVKLDGVPHTTWWRRIDNPKGPFFDRNGETISVTRGNPKPEYLRMDLRSGEVVTKQYRLGEALAQSPDGELVVCRVRENALTESAVLIEPRTGRTRARIDFNRTVTVAEFSADGTRVMVASEDGQTRILAAPDWQVVATLGPHQTRVMGVAFSSSGRLAATAQQGSLIRVWRVDSPHRQLLALGHDTRVTLNRQGTLFALAGRTHEGATLRHSRVYTLAGEPAGPELKRNAFLLDAAFSPDGERLATLWSQEGEERVFLPRPGSRLMFWDWKEGRTLSKSIRMPNEPRSVAWHPDGHQVAVLCSTGQCFLVDAETFDVSELPHRTFTWSADYPLHNGEISYLQDGAELIGWGPSRIVQQWSLQDDPPSRREFKLRATPADLRITRDGVVAAAETRTRSGDPLLHLRVAATGEPVTPPVSHPEWLNGLAFDEREDLLVTTSLDRRARIWEWRDEAARPIIVTQEAAIFTAAFVPGTNSEVLITAGALGQTQLSDARSGVPLSSFRWPGGGTVLEVEVTPDGRRAIMGGEGLGGVGIMHLDALHDPSPLTDDELQDLAEINAGAAIDGDREVIEPLTTAEWLEKWRRFRDQYPNYLAHLLPE